MGGLYYRLIKCKAAPPGSEQTGVDLGPERLFQRRQHGLLPLVEAGWVLGFGGVHDFSSIPPAGGRLEAEAVVKSISRTCVGGRSC